ncbi:hypothetical protein BX661DRAFT_168037 [Kickxella alabastrina]|uniref:uncharacterized protein n=1 Tax=Kickxella alabastrina TaxID=61397 RepID=UPI002220C032|nr:uncharacterized protein BX661DRAFT_168037 [Kickxella alabastrina]KAI7834838.1 hypothetical protein BX661DRAFT_168037 [Kickxella alabastrina]
MWVFECVRRHAPTLTSLWFSERPTADTTRFLHDGKGNAVVVYHNLKSIGFGAYDLEMDSEMDSDSNSDLEVLATTASISEPTVHFLILKYIFLEYSHPYSDNMLFSGNSDTLERLKLDVCPEFCKPFSRIVKFLKHMPRLRTLHCDVSFNPPSINGVSYDRLPGYMLRKRGTFEKHFYNFTPCNHKGNVPVRYIAKALVLLFLECPQIVLLKSDRFKHQYGKHVLDFFTSERFANAINRAK